MRNVERRRGAEVTGTFFVRIREANSPYHAISFDLVMARRLNDVLDSVPTVDRWKLEKEIDYEHKNPLGHVVPKHLGRISESMTDWEGDIADHLGLNEPDRSDIRERYIGEPRLQRY